MTSALAIFLGGGVGALLRSALVPFGNRLSQAGFPTGVMLVNVSGCLIVGMIAGYAASRGNLSPALQNFLVIGVLGGFTTFSAFAADSLRLVTDGKVLQAVMYVVFSVIFSLLAACAGYAFMKQVTV